MQYSGLGGGRSNLGLDVSKASSIPEEPRAPSLPVSNTPLGVELLVRPALRPLHFTMDLFVVSSSCWLVVCFAYCN